MNKYNNTSHENRIHSSTLVPYSWYKNIIPDYFLSVPMHWHDEFEINYIVEGIGEFICDDFRFNAYKGDIILFPSNHLHSIYAHDDYQMIFDTLVFNPTMLGTQLKDRSSLGSINEFVNGYCNIYHIPTTASYYEEAKQAIENIILSAENNDNLSDVLIKSELLRLIWIIEKNENTQNHSDIDVSYSSLIRPCIEYIVLNYTDEITVETLSNIANLSKSYFMNCFKKATGISAMDYVEQIRIKSVCELLISTNLSVSEIAYSCGYNNLSNFNRQFKKLTYTTPLQYKKAKITPK